MSLYQYGDMLVELSQKVKIRVLLSDVTKHANYYDDFFSVITNTCGILAHNPAEHLRRYSEYKNIEIKVLEQFLPYQFIASDMNVVGGYIKMTHWLYKNTAEGGPTIEIYNNGTCEYYENYAEHIDCIWAEARHINFDDLTDLSSKCDSKK